MLQCTSSGAWAAGAGATEGGASPPPAPCALCHRSQRVSALPCSRAGVPSKSPRASEQTCLASETRLPHAPIASCLPPLRHGTAPGTLWARLQLGQRGRAPPPRPRLACCALRAASHSNIPCPRATPPQPDSSPSQPRQLPLQHRSEQCRPQACLSAGAAAALLPALSCMQRPAPVPSSHVRPARPQPRP